ncbi:tRNA (adenosine(37)-N6)-dimethylallyltransferase MiaA [Patescibacteria group bacterium]|nr:tRNA (adenosine(37)-N6)-dimethylallyltransferase MiaA [Patescibacteria group bacterium]
MINKLLVITGPTATGKTALGLKLAEKFNGEIISADSRQVYKFMNIATGKDTQHFQWGIDLVTPDQQFNVSDWTNYAVGVIGEIWKRNKLPIIVGGTGQYIKELLHPSPTLHIPPDEEIRKQLLHCSIAVLQNKLREADRTRWEKMNESDRNNPRRLVRAIEVAKQNIEHRILNAGIEANILIIGLEAPLEVLCQRINRRVEERIKAGALAEKEKLLKMGYQPNAFGYLEKSIEEWKTHEHQYAKRQLNYLKKYLPEIHWYDVGAEDVEPTVAKWYSESNGS